MFNRSECQPISGRVKDYGHWGESIQRVVECYKRDSDAAQIRSLVDEIQRFQASHPDDLDAAFSAAYGFDFDPALWGLTTSSFLDNLHRQLSAPPMPDDSTKH
ncbi:MAG: contact-dependent growth inhibition system immunity protein [Pseudomonadota bacterium]|nr:contact-dependent growth inhibition system immunity protein [Pseudomonadota bacterium]